MNEYYNEGDIINIENFEKHGYYLNEKRDILTTTKMNNGKEFYINKLSFVGFITNQDNKLICIFPKKFDPKDLNDDMKTLFKTISKHKQRRPNIYLGKEYGEKFISSYPFADFFIVYNYYKKHGLYYEDFKIINKKQKGKINWKTTISRSSKFIKNNSLFMIPIYYENNNNRKTFITKCMIFIIEETIEKFGILLNINSISYKKPSLDIIKNRDKIIHNLYNIKSKTFNQLRINLIESMIRYFENYKIGGNYYFKHYTFSTIWEDMVREYLENKFTGVNNGKIDVSGNNMNLSFIKPKMYPNSANKSQYISPDYCYEQNNSLFIFDAKYYKINTLDYKQICYSVFLMNKKDIETNNKIYKKVYSALITPSNQRNTAIHFQMDPIYNSDLRDLIISEEMFVIYDVMKHWVEG